MSAGQDGDLIEAVPEGNKEEANEPSALPTSGSRLFQESENEETNPDPNEGSSPVRDEATGQEADISNLWDDLMKGTDLDLSATLNDQDDASAFNFDNDFDAVNASTFQTPANDSDAAPADESAKDVEPPAEDPGEHPAANGVARARPRPSASGGVKATNPFNIALKEVAAKWEQENEEAEGGEGETSPLFTSTANPFAGSDGDDVFNPDSKGAGQEFNPFATIHDVESEAEGHGGGASDGFDLFQTIHGDEGDFQVRTDDAEVSFFQDNPFGEPPAEPDDENFADFGEAALGDQPTDSFERRPGEDEEEEEEEDDQEELEPLPPFHPKWEFGDGWNLLLRQPFKKKLTQNRFWKPAYVRIMVVNDVPMIRIFPNDKDPECLYELALQVTHGICDLGLQQLDQYGKCHTVKIQQVNYKETVGVKADRIAPTIGDLTRVRDLKGLKDLMHKPKATMILDHAANAMEVLKFGTLVYADIKRFTHAVEDLLFWQKAIRGRSASYTKDEITVDVLDEYYAEIDKEGHITSHKARVRLFCLAFLSESPIVEVGVNDKRRRGREVVGRQDIIPIKTEEWIRIEDYELHGTIDKEEFERSKVLRFNPLDACRYEIMRFRVRPRVNVELPLQIRVQTSIVERHVEVRVEVMVTGYYSNSRRAAQTPCEDIQVRIPIPEEWVYMFRVEKRFKYGAVHSSKRKAGKIKGLERLTAFAQGILPPSLIEVSAGLAKYEQAFHAVVWRIDQLPERNEGAYKTHLMAINLDLAPHDKMPEELDKYVHVEYSMANSTVSRAQVRSIAIASGADEPPDRWVRHLARYEYKIETEFTDRVKPQSEDILAPLKHPAPVQSEEGDSNAPRAAPEEDSDNSSSDSD